jgi:NitT/TauT family transport system substrate-binding protein
MRRLVPALLSLLAGLAVTAAAQNKKPVEVELALNWKAEPQFGGFYAAERSGAYASNGLAVTIQEGGAGTPTVQMVAAGRVDFGIVSADEAVVARSKGADVVALFAVYQTNPQGIMTHAERNFAGIKDVYASEGTLAIQAGLPYSDFLKNKFKDVKVKIVPYQGGIASFLSDPKFSQQCFVTSEPLLATKQGKIPKSFLIADEGYNPYTTVLVTNGDYLKKNEATVKKMVAAVRAGWEDYLKDPEPTNAVMAKLNKSMDAATFTASAAAQKALIETPETKTDGLGVMTEARWSELAKQLADMKYIDKAPTATELFRWYSADATKAGH